MKLPQIILLLTSALLTGCGSSKHIQTIPVETIKEITRTDTLYINNVQYDSIFVLQKTTTDRSKDTILIRHHDVEYRYKLLRDTIYKTKMELQRDSIPYEVRITEVKEVKHIPPWIQYLAWAGGLSILLFIVKIYQ